MTYDPHQPPGMTNFWAAIEIGCTACRFDTRVIGVFTDVDAAIAAADKTYDEHSSGGACSQYGTEVHRMPRPTGTVMRSAL